MTRYAPMFQRLEASDAGAFIPFVMLGDPTPERSLAILDTLVAAGADALELGIPFSDPIADGPTIQAAAIRAMGAGVSPGSCWEILAEARRRHPDVPFGLLVYANLVVGRGVDDFYRRAADAGVDSVLVADVPSIECGPFCQAAIAADVDPVLIAAPNTPADKLGTIAEAGRGYTYVVTRAGVTGAEVEAGQANGDLLSTLAGLGAPPAVAGFGISAPEHVRATLDAGAAGAISGSAVVRRIAAHLDDDAAMHGALGEFVGEMKAATRR